MQDCALLGVVYDGPLGVFCCGEQGHLLCHSWAASVGKLSPHLHPAAGTPGQGEMLGVEMGAVTVITVRNKSALVEEEGKCLDLSRRLTNLDNRIQSRCGRCIWRATQTRKLGPW